MSDSRCIDRVGLLAALSTAGLNFLFVVIDPGPWFIFGACLFWLAFILIRVCRDRSILREWGFRIDNLREASKIPLLLFIVGVMLLGVVAHFRDTLTFPLHTSLLFLIYPIWGVIQQFLVLGIVVNNLEKIKFFEQNKIWLVLIGATLFGSVHVYDLRLVPATFVLELFIVPLYLKHRNLWPMGALHGWLGGLLYLWILNRDLWVEYLN